MQNWNQWQLPAATATAPMPQPPIGYAAPGADPMATMQAYMQYYNQPAPSGYTAEQWSVAQQQNWVQWQTWQQQYQQWQAQYGEKYQETMKQMSSQGLPGLAQVPTLTTTVQPPPLPKEDTSVKPPLPPDAAGVYGAFTGVPPPHQNNLPLFPSKQSANPPLPPGQPPLPSDISSESTTNDGNLNGKRGASSNVDTGSAKKLKIEDDELTEAEKTFDGQFKKWEEQFNKWKQQNANHPDKTQYKQYEAKWTSWREKLIERREQMRRKREQQRQAAAKVEAEKNKSMSGDDKILNILSSTENQGLINNLLGIGKTLGLTGKQETPVPPPVEPPPVFTAPQATVLQPMGAPTMTANMNQAAWAAQQWAAQYNAGMNMSNYSAGYQQSGPIPPAAVNNFNPSMPPTNFNQPPGNYNQPLANFNQPPGNFNQPPGNFNQPPGNFNQPPPGMPVGVPNMSNAPPNISTGGPNFSQPPPSLNTSDNSRQQSSQEPRNSQDSNSRSFRNDGDQRQGGPFSSRDSIGSGNDRFGFDGNRFNEPPPSNDRSGNNRGGQFGSDENFGRDSHNKDFGSNNQCGNDNFRRDGNTRDFSPSGRSGNFDSRGNDRIANNDSDCFGSGYDKDQEDPFDDTDGNNRFGSSHDSFNTDRFNNSSDRVGSNNDRFSSLNDRFGSGNNRFSSGNDRSGNDNQPRLSGDRFGPPNDRFSSGNDKFASGDRFSSMNDRAGQSNDTRFNRPPPDRFDSHDGSRDSFGCATKSFGTNNQFKPADDMSPELKKLMEKRRAAMDVFKPSSFGSFLDSDKNSSAGTSLSESFRKITGDSPFLSRTSNDFGNKDKSPSKGPPPGSGGSGNFDASRDFRPGDNSNLNFRGPGDFGSRGPGDLNSLGHGAFPSRGNEPSPREFDTPPGGPRRSGDIAPRLGSEFGPRMRNDIEPSRNDSEQKDNFGPPVNRDSTPDKTEKMLPSSMRDSKPLRVAVDRKQPTGNQKDSKAGTPNIQNVPPLSMPPWMDPDFDDDVIEIPADKSSEPTMLPFSRVDKDKTKRVQDSASVNLEESNNTRDSFEKKSDALPFMGENDPKPEDLNMEPPPEFPNLGPVMKGPDSPFGQRGGNMSGPFGPSSGDFDSRPPFNAPFGPRGMQPGPRGPMVPPFGPRGPNDARFPPFGPRGMAGPPENMGPSGPFGPHGPNSGGFGPRGPQDERFNSCGPSMGNFGPQSGNFGPRGPNDCGPHPGNFGPCGPNDFGPRGPNDFVPGGPNDFGPGGPPNFGSHGPGNFDARGPPDVGNRGPSDTPFGACGSGDRPFGPRGPLDQPFGPCPPNNAPYGPRGPNNAPFGPRGPHDMPFRPRTPNDSPFGPRGPNAPFAPRPPFASNALAPRGNFDGPQSSIPSLMSFKFDRPNPSGRNDPSKDQDDKDDRLQDLPPAFRAGDQDLRPFAGDKAQGDSERTGKEMEPDTPTRGPGGPEWRQPFMRNKFGDFDQRTGPGDTNEGLSDDDVMDIDRVQVAGDFPVNRPIEGNQKMKSRDKKNSGIDSKPGFEQNRGPISTDLMPPRNDERRGIRGGQKVFCIEKQFNYNHSGGVPDEIMTEHKPAKVIDYAHAPRIVVDDYLTPAQCFDYEHGRNKPNPPNHGAYLNQDFRNWEESEHNLKEYADRMRIYESDLRTLNRGFPPRDTEPPVQMRESSWIQEDRRSYERDRRSRNERSRRDTDNFRDKERENRERARLEREREWERISNKHREDRAHQRRSNSRDRTRERNEKIRQESIKENNKDDERSKGNLSGQESSAKNPTESTAQDNSREETKHAEPDGSPKTIEMSDPVEPPKTMELPKTPNFTMVDDLLCPPGRQNRPPKIVVILRGPPGSGKSFIAKLIKDKEVEQGGSAPRILSLDDYFLTEKEVETIDDNGKKITTKNLVYEYEEAMEPSYIGSLVKAFKKNITDGFFNFIILDSINEKISDYEEMWSFAKTKGFRVYVCEMEMDVQICLKRNIHKRTEDEVNRIVDYFEPTPNYHQKLDVTSMLQEEAIEEVQMEDSQDIEIIETPANDDSQDSQEDQDSAVVSKWEKMEADDKLDRLDGLAKRKNEGKPQTMEDFLQVPDYYNMEDTSGKKRVRWADLEERKEQEKMRAVGFVVGQTNWDRMMDPTKGGSALTRTKYI